MRRTVGEPGMPLHGKWLGPGALGRSASIRAGIVWASLGASFKNLTGQEFHGTAYHDPEDKARRYNKQSYGRGRAWGHDFLGHRFGWGPHRFACLSHPCRVSGPFLINLIVLNSDGGSYEAGFKKHSVSYRSTESSILADHSLVDLMLNFKAYRSSSRSRSRLHGHLRLEEVVCFDGTLSGDLSSLQLSSV